MSAGGGGGGGGAEVGGEVLVAGRVGDGGDDGLGDGGVGGQGGLDLAELDALAADLDLVVVAAEEGDGAVGAAAGEVAGLVQPVAGAGAERVGDEFLAGEAGPAQVAAGDSGAADVQLPGDAGRDRVEVGVKHVGAVVRPAWPADRRRGHGGVQLGVGGKDGGLGGAVAVDEPQAGP